jgi:hypothetical protein
MIRQFDVVDNASALDPGEPPLLINLQADVLGSCHTYVVAPLWPSGTATPGKELAIPVDLDTRSYVISIAELSSVPKQILGDTVANLEHQRDAIIRALDFLFTGI